MCGRIYQRKAWRAVQKATRAVADDMFDGRSNPPPYNVPPGLLLSP